MDTVSFAGLTWLIALQFALYAVGWALFSVLLRSERAAVANWSAFMLLMGVGFHLASGRDETRQWLPYVGSALAYVLGWACLRRGLMSFMRAPAQDTEIFLSTAGVCALLVLAGPSAEAASLRVVVTYGTGLYMMVRTLQALRGPTLEEFGVRTMALAALPGIVLVLGFASRVVHQIADWAHPLEMQSDAGINRQLLTAYLIGAAMFNFSFMALLTLRLVRKLRVQAREDALTGLPNRRALEHDLQQAWERFRAGDGAFAVVALDLDHFKRINDEHGHLAGDAVLEQLGRRLRAAVRDYDIVARTGGEEFTVLMRGADAERARASALRLIETVREAPFHLPGCSLRLTISAGLTLVQPADTSVEQVIKRADGALYRAKDNGRDRLELALA